MFTIEILIGILGIIILIILIMLLIIIYLNNKNNDKIEIIKENINSNEIRNSIYSDNIEKNINSINSEIRTELNQFLLTQETLGKNNYDFVSQIINNLSSNLKDDLNEIKIIVGDNLEKTLDNKLNSNFKQINEQLNSLYKTLGEMQKISSTIDSLNKTLSNVKLRGTWGEIQLGAIIEETMDTSQYEKNVITKTGSSDRIEFAIKIPSKEDDSFLYLPIDSKMPIESYNRIIEASEKQDVKALSLNIKELENTVKKEARRIRDKYIDPPNTTDFAIMFLPTEGLYSEVLRINGLAEWCQTNCKITISGPTTITAILNGFRVGFSNMALNKESQKVQKLFKAIKAQMIILEELTSKTLKKLNDATQSAQEIENRTRIIGSKMKNIEIMDSKEADEIFEMGDIIND